MTQEKSRLEQAIELVKDKGEVSVPLLQRHLKVSFRNAINLIEEMITQGVVVESGVPKYLLVPDQAVSMAQGSKDKYGVCPECGAEAVQLATAEVNQFWGDGDDKKGGISEYGDVDITSEAVCVFGHICFECNFLVDVGIESPRDKALNTSTRGAK